MGIHRPVLFNVQTGAGYALQFAEPHSFAQVLQNASGEVYVYPLFGTKPSGAAISTSDGASIITANPNALQAMTPASMVGITVGTALTIDQGLASKETVLVQAVTATTFSAVFRKAHSGAALAITVNGTTMDAAPTGTPAPAAGQPAIGWYHMNASGAKRSVGVEANPAAGTPGYPMATADTCYGFLVWCVTATELEIIAH